MYGFLISSFESRFDSLENLCHIPTLRATPFVLQLWVTASFIVGCDASGNRMWLKHAIGEEIGGKQSRYIVVSEARGLSAKNLGLQELSVAGSDTVL